MKIWQGIGHFNKLPFAVVTSGTFDGVHLGHRKILGRLTELAKKYQGESVVLTYWPHPRLVLNPSDTSIRLLNTFREKCEKLEALGIDHLISIPFTRSFSEMSADQFVREVLVDRIGTRKLVIGYDHHFGKNREGNFEQLTKAGPVLGFEVEEIPREDIDDAGISSSAIRRFLNEGTVLKANQLLGDPYVLRGKVVGGEQIGRQLGFPTANISLEKSDDADSIYKLIPADGIYAVLVRIGSDQHAGMLYIGNRPTVGGVHKVVEVNILDFNRQIYGEMLEVVFIDRIRGDIRFESLDELKAQLVQDRISTIEILQHGN